MWECYFYLESAMDAFRDWECDGLLDWERVIVNLRIRAFAEQDLEDVLQLSLSAWEPVFRSFKQVLGPEIYPIVYPDWRKSQREGVESTCKDTERFNILVAQVDGRVVGFLAYELNLEAETGEVMLLAVNPEYQDRGIGTELNIAALQEMKAAGMKLAVVGTGGDEGHAPARRSYEKAGYTALPLVRYYQAL
jgi:ribosomal protein S18 acetylase RimI-like enzyme